MADKKIWIDVTLLVGWSGQLTGIQRVEYNLAKRFAAEKNVGFCVFDKVSQKCFEFDFRHIEYKVSQLQTPNNMVGAQVSQPDFPSIYRRVLKKVYKTTLRKLPLKVSALAGRGYRALRGSSPQHKQTIEVDFRKGDLLLILSGDWSDNIFADWVKVNKTNRQISILQIVYDMLPYVEPAYFVEGMSEQFSRYMEKIFRVSDGILAISESTKRDVERFMEDHAIQKVAIEVFRLGDDFVKLDEVKPRNENISKKYILCVGTVEARKNHLLLYYAVRESILKNIDIPQIVIVGKIGWLAKEFHYLVSRDPKISQKFVFLNQCTDQELAWLFRNSLFTVYPSYYEGWGLPIAESLFYGKYCLSSNSSSMPEIAGDLIEYFSPNDPIDLFNKVKLYSTNIKLLDEKEANIKKHYIPTSWDKTFREVKEFVNSYMG